MVVFKFNVKELEIFYIKTFLYCLGFCFVSWACSSAVRTSPLQALQANVCKARTGGGHQFKTSFFQKLDKKVCNEAFSKPRNDGKTR